MKKKKTRHTPITEGEAKALALLPQGLSNQQIAKALGRSPHTVKKHIENMLAKTGAKNRLKLCIKVGLIRLNSVLPQYTAVFLPPKTPRRRSKVAG